MANGKRASSSMPTEAENLKEPQVLNPTVRSYSLNEYEQKRPDYINPDHNAGKSWAQLGRSLDDFYSAFMKYSDNELQRTMERDIARGAVLADDLVEAEGAKANRRNWKQLTEEHPELAGYNPWVQQGYNRSRLRNLGREMQDGLQQALNESGLYNQDDPEAVRKFTNDYCAKWRKEAGIEDEQDAVLLAKSFSPIEAEARQGAMDSYTSHHFAQQQYKLAQACSDEISNILNNSSMSLEQQNAAIKLAVEDANSHGLLTTNSEAVVPEAIKAAYAMSHNEKLLDRVASIDINGRKLIEYKGVPEWVSAEKLRIAQKQAAQAQKAAADYSRYLSQTVPRMADEAALKFYKHELTFDQLDEFAKTKGITDPAAVTAFKATVIRAANVNQSYDSLQYKTPDAIIETQDKISYIRGNFSQEGQIEMFKSLYDETHNDAYLKAWEVASNREASDAKSMDSARVSQGNFAYSAFAEEASKYVGDEIDRIKSTEQGKAKRVDRGAATAEIAKRAKDEYTRLIGARLSELEEQGIKITPSVYKEESNKIILDLKTNKFSGFIGDSLSRTLLINTNTTQDQIINSSLYTNIPQDKFPQADRFRNETDEFLSSRENNEPYVKNIRSFNKLESYVDTAKMFNDGYTGPITIDSLIKYARKGSPYYGLVRNSDGSFSRSYKSPSDREFLDNMLKMENPDAKVSTDTSSIKYYMNSKDELTRDENLKIYEIARSKGINSARMTPAMLSFFTGNSGNSVGKITMMLKRSGMSDMEILDMFSQLARSSSSSRNNSGSAQAKGRPTVRDSE